MVATIMAISIYVISAICGNFWQESGINPGIWQGLKESSWTSLLVGYGLGQWTNTGGDTHGRLYRLHDWLTTNGYPDNSGPGQLDYLIYEDVWYPRSEYPWKTLTEFLETESTDIAELTHAYNRCWEGIKDDSWDLRVDYAYQCYEYISQHKDDSSITTWYTGNRYLSIPERLNNAVLVYRYLNGYDPGPGPGPSPEPIKSRGKIWMFVKHVLK